MLDCSMSVVSNFKNTVGEAQTISPTSKNVILLFAGLMVGARC